MASTCCPACATPVEHRADWVLDAVRAVDDGEVTTKLVANRTLVVHACTHPELSTTATRETRDSSPKPRAKPPIATIAAR